MSSKEMPVTTLAAWFGGKVGMAPTIVQWLGPHKSYVEPFAGGMAVLLAKPQCQFEMVNDLHGDIINLALTVQHAKWGAWLYRSLRRCLFNEVVFAFARRALNRFTLTTDPERVSEESARRAYYYFILNWMGRKGISGLACRSQQSFSVRYNTNGGNQAQRFHSVVRSITQWRKRFRSVTILCRDGFKLIKRLQDASDQAVYCDPPYLIKSNRYLHDFSKADHERLAIMLRRFKKSRIVVSYYDHQILTTLYPVENWLKVDCSRDKRLLRSLQQNAKPINNEKAQEVLLINRSSIKDS